MKKVRIALDAMGGDNAPFAPCRSLEFIRTDHEIEVYAVGDDAQMRKILAGRPVHGVTLIHCARSIQMGEKVNRRLLHDDETSMSRVLTMVKRGEVDCALSAGNTAGFVGLAITRLGLIEGVDRPAIAITLPTVTGGRMLLLDVGANVNAKPRQLLQYGLMGRCTARKILGISQPRVGLLNIGEEQEKGDDLRREAYQMLAAAHGATFVGNIEGQELLTGKADVVVTDGFTGNVVLKASEGVARSFRTLLRREILKNIRGRIGAFLLSRNFRDFARRIDYAEYGGGILLGVNGTVIVSHGRSSARAIHHAMLLGRKAVRERLLEELTLSLAQG